MSYSSEIVVRKKNEKYYAGFANHYPLNAGYKKVASYGGWYGCQMSYRPFRAAMQGAIRHANNLNKVIK